MPRFSPAFLDELKSRLRPSDVVGRHVALKKQGNEWAGLSPFTNEKTPSFFVNDQKAFWHCFSSGKSGDVITFLQETQNLSFLEAVEALAEQAGMELPKASPADAERERKSLGLVEACEQAAKFFRTMLRRQVGAEALAYLKRRGLTDETIAAFDLGFAPNDRSALKDYLVNKDFPLDVLVEAGLLIRPEDGGAPYDRFRGRVMFPIEDDRGRVIAFGGRALDKNQKAKYLNSPETPIFHKGSVLYNFVRARTAAKDQPLVVCEGYMDVIAIAQAGFEAAVAPLGTALTEDQIQRLWRIADEPVLCFDGDRAGTAAARRAIERALPLLKPGRSLNFALLSGGRDPDDVVREEGASGFRAALDAARPLVEVLWERERAATPLDTPERRAAFRTRLRAAARLIADPDVRRAYEDDFRRRLDAERAGAAGPRRRDVREWRPGGRFVDPPGQQAAPARLGKRGGAEAEWVRQGLLLLAPGRHPSLIARHETDFEGLDLDFPELAALRDDMISAFMDAENLDFEGLTRHLADSASADTWRRLETHPGCRIHPFAKPEADENDAEQGWLAALAKHRARTFDEDVRIAARGVGSGEAGEKRWRAAAAMRASAAASEPGGQANED